MKTINYRGNSAKTGIYQIKNILNGKLYIGSTKRSFHSRKTKHLLSLINNRHYNEHLQNSWNKYGSDNFVFEILLIIDKDITFWEAEFIKKYKSDDRLFGYNIASVENYKFNYTISENHNYEKSLRKLDKLNKINGLYSKERGLNKPIKIYTTDGIYIETLKSGKELCEKYSMGKSYLSTCLSKRKLFNKGYIVIFENDSLSEEDIKSVKQYIVKKVYLYDLNDNYLQEFKSAKEAALFLNCKEAEVRMCCTNRRNRIKNYKTKYSKCQQEDTQKEKQDMN